MARRLSLARISGEPRPPDCTYSSFLELVKRKRRLDLLKRHLRTS
jgi:hypothetical protein